MLYNYLKTTDQGKTWLINNCIGDIGFCSVFFTDENTGYIMGGGMLKTTDGGGNRTEVNDLQITNYDLRIIVYPNPLDESASCQLSVDSK